MKPGGISLSENAIEPFKEKFGFRLMVKCEEVKFRLQAPVEGENDALGQVQLSIVISSINYRLVSSTWCVISG